MSSFWNFVFSFVLVTLWLISGVFITIASIDLTPYKDKDNNLNRAYWFAFWASFVTWFLVGSFIILVILAVVGVVALFGSGVGEAGVAAEGAEGEASLSQFRGYAQSPEGQSAIGSGISWLTLAFLIFALILVTITGVLSAIAASSMAESPNFDRSIVNLDTAYTDCIVAASVCLGAGGILLIGTIVYFIIGWRNQRARDKEYEQIRQLRAQAIRKTLLESAQQKQLAQLQQQELRQQLLQNASQSVNSNPMPINIINPETISSDKPISVTPITQSGVSVSLPSSVNIPLPSSLSRYLS